MVSVGWFQYIVSQPLLVSVLDWFAWILDRDSGIDSDSSPRISGQGGLEAIEIVRRGRPFHFLILNEIFRASAT